MPTLYLAPAANYFSTTLSAAINSSQTTGITLTSVTNLQAPGYLVLDREDGSGNQTPNAREVISFTGITGSELTGVTRNADNSTARSHNSGALAESAPTVGMWNSLATIIDRSMTTDSYLKAIASPVSISAMHVETLSATSIASIPRFQMVNQVVSSTASIMAIEGRNLVTSSIASVAVGFFRTRLDASGASLSGLGLTAPGWLVSGNISGATTNPGGPLVMPRAGTWRSALVTSRFGPVSTASLVIDINKNQASIFAAATRMSIAAAGTLNSTASIATKNFDQGDVLSFDVDAFGGANGYVRGVTVQLISD